jgi:1-acyl-sn-glycerol-3-phosphate acyltransferase
VNGLGNLPPGHSVVVANHASYIDGFLLKGYLPARFSFVIKGEVRNIPVVHFLLRRAGSRFVERFEAAGSARDARQIVKAAQGGESLAFFAEGTFRKFPGLGRLRPGAFVAAVKGRMPVVPAVITGTRAMMPGGIRLPKPGPLRIDILPAIMPDDLAFTNHRELAELARQRILDVLDEPDLLAE